MVRRYTRRLRSRLADLSPEQQMKFLGTKAAFKSPTSRRAGWWLQAELEDLNEEQQAFVERLHELCPSAARAVELARWFREMVKERRHERLNDWLDATEQTELESFAHSLRKDYKAVRAALSYEWSNGQVEGQIHRLKLFTASVTAIDPLDGTRSAQRSLGCPGSSPPRSPLPSLRSAPL